MGLNTATIILSQLKYLKCVKPKYTYIVVVEVFMWKLGFFLLNSILLEKIKCVTIRTSDINKTIRQERDDHMTHKNTHFLYVLSQLIPSSLKKVCDKSLGEAKYSDLKLQVQAKSLWNWHHV